MKGESCRFLGKAVGFGLWFWAGEIVISTWMHKNKWGDSLGVITHVKYLTIDPNFLGHPSILALFFFGGGCD